ncbi:hypothetical protein BDZ89DRAFT_1061963 [Hymenopellis radicata]|nr:hypothetical protein BDZ89DRAFT_1061963 [Hymenopellis radicata]
MSFPLLATVLFGHSAEYGFYRDSIHCSTLDSDPIITVNAVSTPNKSYLLKQHSSALLLEDSTLALLFASLFLC